MCVNSTWTHRKKGKGMAKNRLTTDPMLSKLREVRVEPAMGLKVPPVCKKLEMTK